MTYAGQPQVPDGQDEQSDRGAAVLAAIWTYLSVTTVVLVLRFYAQIRTQRKTATDDYFMILAWVSQVIGNGLVTYAVYRGLGRPSYYLSLEDRIQVVKYEYIGGAWGIISPALGRISYALFLLSVLRLLTTVRRIFLWVLIALQVVVNLLALIIIFVQCHPTSRVWDPSVPGYCVSVHVQGDIGFAQGAINTLSDLVLTVIGITVVLHLKVRKWTKVILVVLMGLSSIAMAASIVRTIELQKLESTEDFTWETVPFVIWYTLETNVVMIAASLPKIRPLVMLLQRRYSSSRGSSERDSDFHGPYDEESARARFEAPERRRRRSTLSRLKFAWDPHATRLSGTRDSGYSSSDLRTPPSYNNESALTSVSSMGSNQERFTNPFTRWLRSPARPSPQNRQRSNSITLAQLSRRSPAKKKKHQRSYSMSSRSPHASPRTKHFPFALSHTRTRSSNRNVSDRNSVIPALQNQKRGKTTISAGGPLPPSVPTSMPGTPRPGSGGISERTSINNDYHENEYTGPPLTGIRSVGPVCIWRTREYTIQYEDNDEDPESTHVDGEPGPTYDEAEADGLELHDIGGILGESSQQETGESDRSEVHHDTDLCSPLSTVEEVPTEGSDLRGLKDILREGNNSNNNKTNLSSSTYDEAAADQLHLSDIGGILSDNSEDTGTNTGTNSAGKTSPRHKDNDTSEQATYDPAAVDRLDLSDAGGILDRFNETNSGPGMINGNGSNSRSSAPSSTHQATYDPDIADRLELSDVGGILNGHNNDTP
ncbi:hypothetical protein Plec18167_000084 [Paecilomyces lecythidis]|uniref:Rhodopsin domain-containing protein n=1 Tax=Paecilomyces lecythidis TaxID=3004212 RepID=A0ABR3YDW3_9EURO